VVHATQEEDEDYICIHVVVLWHGKVNLVKLRPVTLLHCFDAAGWVIRPVKLSSLKCPITCQVKPLLKLDDTSWTQSTEEW